MHWFAIALLALLLGFIVGPINSWVTSVIPASTLQNTWVKAFVNGGIILLAVFVSVFLLSVIGVRESKI